MSEKNPALGEIRRWHKRAGGVFFDPDTMHYLGDTLKSFRVETRAGITVIERIKPMASLDGNKLGGVGQKWIFDPVDCSITPAPVKAMKR